MDFLEKNDLLDETSRISDDSKSQITGLAYWLKIAAILSFVGLVISTLDLILRFMKLKPGFDVPPGSSDIFTHLITIGISLLLNITLLQATKFLNIGLQFSDQSNFNLGIRKFTTYFRIYGILTIIILIIFVLALIIGIFAAAFGR
jgi:hypothetical protein